MYFLSYGDRRLYRVAPPKKSICPHGPALKPREDNVMIDQSPHPENDSGKSANTAATARKNSPCDRRLLVCVVLGILLIGLTLMRAAYAQTPESINVPINKSSTVDLDRPIKRVSMGNPQIADIVVLRSRQVYILGKSLGSSNVLLWDSNDNLVREINVNVTHDLSGLKESLHQLLPNEKVEVYSTQGSIVLKGQVSNLFNLDSIVRIAKSYAIAGKGDKDKKSAGDNTSAGGDDKKKKDDGAEQVVNLLTVGGSQQVMLKVTVAELKRDTLKKLGIKFYAYDKGTSKWGFGGVNGGGSFPDATFGTDGLRIPVFSNLPLSGPVIDEFAPNDLSILDKGLFATFLGNDFVFGAALEAAKDNGTAKILAEPNLTTLSGQEAKFLSGGEFPIPVPDRDGLKVEFKEFGVALRFMPVVLSSGNINLKLNVSVSELTATNSVTISAQGNSTNSNAQFFVPALTNRSAATTVELANGQTIGIAGMIREDMRGLVHKFPGLGDVPILGQLFRSEQFERGQTELVIMVTPVLVKPMNQRLSRLPTDSFVEPSDAEFYLLGRAEGRTGRRTSSTATESTSTNASRVAPVSGGVDGQFGHSIQ